MEAVTFREFGTPEVMQWEILPDPSPGPHDVVIGVVACGVNHVDLDIREGSSRLPIRFPHILGLEPTGIIEEIGSEVEDLAPGQCVAVLHQLSCGKCRYCRAGQEELCTDTELFGVHRAGGYATRVLAPDTAIIPLPPNSDLIAASVSQTTFCTAWHALNSRAHLEAGETVLVNAAGSGVGTAAIQIAQLLGGKVIASAGRSEKLESAAKMGAIETINYQTDDLGSRVLEVTDGHGVDVVMECVGGTVISESVKAIAPNGRIVTVGAHAGEVAPIDIIRLFRQQGSLLGSVRATGAEIRHVLGLVARGVLKPVVAGSLPMSEASAAHKMVAERSVYGRIALTTVS